MTDKTNAMERSMSKRKGETSKGPGVSKRNKLVQPARTTLPRKAKTDAVESMREGGSPNKKLTPKKDDKPVRRGEEVLRRERAQGLWLPEHERVLADLTEEEVKASFKENKKYLDKLWRAYTKSRLPDKVPSIESALWATRSIPSKMHMFMLQYLDKNYTNADATSPSHSGFFMNSAIPEWITLMLVKKLNCTKDEVRAMHK